MPPMSMMRSFAAAGAPVMQPYQQLQAAPQCMRNLLCR